MIIEIIEKKKNGLALTKDELTFAFEGFLKGNVPDYQMSSLLMAICLRGLNEDEIFCLTDLFLKSGEILDWSSVEGIKVDKHSTGGVGDKTTLVLAPLVAACLVPVVKMSGRGLGHTGGTIDKLESIPGYRTDLTEEEIKRQVEQIGVVVTGQTKDLVPMDKKVYALRDVTGTVESLGLIATSIMSKKLASGADKILIDIKVGNGALIKTGEDAEVLSEMMKKIGNHYGREVQTVFSDMNVPLGRTIGNSLEVMEAIDVLKGKEQNEFSSLCIDLASRMVSMAKGIDLVSSKQEVMNALLSGKALSKFLELIKAQGGDLSHLSVSEKVLEIKSEREGVVRKIDALKMAKYSMNLGAGRKEEGDQIDPEVGIYLEKLVDDSVQIGDTLCRVYYHDDLPKEDIASYFTIESF